MPDINDLEAILNALFSGNWQSMEIAGATSRIYVLAATMDGRVAVHYIQPDSDDLQMTIEFTNPQLNMNDLVSDQASPWRELPVAQSRTYTVIFPAADYWPYLHNAMYNLNIGILQCLVNEEAPSFFQGDLAEYAALTEEIRWYEQTPDFSEPPTPAELEAIARIQARIKNKLRESRELEDQSSE